MRIQPLSGINPYASYLDALQNGVGSGGGNGLDSSLQGVPAIKGNLISRIQRYEQLGNALNQVMTTLGLPTQTSAASNDTLETLTTDPIKLSQTPSAAAVLTSDHIALASAPSTDFGSLTINGVTTSLGVFNGNSATDAAQFIAEKLNANANNPFTATVGGSQKDQVILTGKTTGSSDSLLVQGAIAGMAGSTVGLGYAGFTAGMYAQGTDSFTDLGQISINGVMANFGVIDNSQYSVQQAAQYMAATLNQTPGMAVTATVGGSNGDQLILMAHSAGQTGHFTITSASNDSDGTAANNGHNGFTPGTSSASPADLVSNDVRASLLLLDQLSKAAVPASLNPLNSTPMIIPDNLNAPQPSSTAASPTSTQATAASSFVQSVNDYLSALDEQRKNGLVGVANFENEFLSALNQYKAQLSALGISMVGEGLQFDPTAQTDSSQFQADFARLRDALTPMLTSQQRAMADIHQFADSVDTVATQISQASVNLDRLNQQSVRLASMVHFMDQQHGLLGEQADVLQKQQAVLSPGVDQSTSSSL